MKNLVLVALGLVAGQVLALPNYLAPRVDDSVLYEEVNSRIAASFEERWFNQTVDHFRTYGYAPRNKKYLQRYFVNDLHYKPGGPALLYIGGEGELNGLWTTNSMLSLAAEQLGGVVYGLEHRYYGKSQPTANWSLNNLKHLSSLQALEDLAKFVREVPLPSQKGNGSYVSGSKPKTKWIVVGGSYPGNLAAWARFKYPHLIDGAIASSAPVLAKEYFFEFDQQVQKSLLYNGGEQCLNYHLNIFKSIDRTLNSKDKKRINALKTKFTCQNVADNLFADSLNFVSGIVLFNNNNRPTNVKTYCASIKVNGTIAEKIDDFANGFKQQLGGRTCEQIVDNAPLESIVPIPASPARQWLYQSCNEFGYWQLAPPKPLPAARSRIPTVGMYNRQLCGDVFKKGTGPNTAFTNGWYLGKLLRFSNIVFTNGELDPWAPLSILPNYPGQLKSMPSYIIKGASHATDISLPSRFDTPAIAEAKKRNIEHIKNWVQN